ncbi:MAG TPA: hypothetical protein VE031_02525 [Chthoniobacterales bacterium]|nr:hypothetical protein [Chthoniobacterales bacterium]
MTPQKENGAGPRMPEEAARYYRCSACGEQVDNQSREEIRLHSYHLLHREEVDPQRYPVLPAARLHAAQTWIHRQVRVCLKNLD